MPTISQLTTITTAHLAGVVFHAGSGRSPPALLRVRAQGRGVGGEPGVPCPHVVGPDGRPWHGAERIEELLVEQLAVVLTGAVPIR